MSAGQSYRPERAIRAASLRAETSAVDYRAMFDAQPLPHLVLDRNFDVIEVNQAYLDVTMRQRTDLIGTSIFGALPTEGESRELLQQSLLRTLEYGRVDTIPLVACAIPRPPALGGGFEQRQWSITHVPLRDGDGRLTAILQQVQDITELQRLRDAGFGFRAGIDSGDVLRRAEAIQAVNDTLLAEHHHLRRLFMQAPGMMCVLSGADLVIELVNNAYLEVIGHRDVIGLPMREALPELAGQGHFRLLETVMATGQAFVGQGMRIALQRRPDEPPEERYFDLVYQPIFASDDSVSGIFLAGVDITDRIFAQEQQRLLMDELNHRVKNTLATVQAIAAQTLRSSGSPEDFVATFQSRLMALSRTHNALTRGQWQGAELIDILKEELRPYGSGRIELRGPSMRLPPRAALSLGMVFHELAINAAKYGALSSPQGRLMVSCDVEPVENGATVLRVEWREAGGPPVAAPERRGFGSRLIERSIGGDLDGEVAMDYAVDGLVCRFSVMFRGRT